MENQLKRILRMNTMSSLTECMVFEIDTLLSAVKARAVVMMSNTHSNHHLQRHLREIVFFVDESFDRTKILGAKN